MLCVLCLSAPLRETIDGGCRVRSHAAREDTRPPARQATPDSRQPPLGRDGARPSRSFLCVKQKTDGTKPVPPAYPLSGKRKELDRKRGEWLKNGRTFGRFEKDLRLRGSLW